MAKKDLSAHNRGMTAAETPPEQTPPHPPALDCWYLTGPTASGKTPIGIELAERLDAEILSLDSMALYREMNIGTAKPTPEQQARTPHHLLDLHAPNEECSLSEYVRAAHEAISAIRQRGKEVLFVGGTPLYLKSLLRGVHEGPPPDWEFRDAIEREVEQVGLAALQARLEQVDPLTAAKLHPHDKRRMIRALEVYKLTGRPLSHQQTQFEFGQPADRCRVFCLWWPRPELHARIEHRVEQMFAAGLVEEVRGLLDRYGQLSRTAAQAVGYREVIEHLQGERDLPATVERVKTRTRQFARRQETWFNSLSECRRVVCEPDKGAGDYAAEILVEGAQARGPGS